MKKPVILTGDIGGTSIRLSIFEGSDKEIVCEQYRTQDFSSLKEAIDNFLSMATLNPDIGVLGVPGPVRQGIARTTNIQWDLDEAKISEKFPIKLFNDLELLSYSIPFLAENQYLQLQNQNTILETVGIVAPGTGLGQAAILKRNGEWITIDSEGGHVNFAPSTGLEWELYIYLRQTLKRVSVERLLSGPGIYNIFRFMLEKHLGYSSLEQAAVLNRVHKEAHPIAYITDIARKLWSDTDCNKQELVFKDTMRMMISILGSHAGNVALSLNANAIYLGGGIPNKIIDLLLASNILDAFTDKGRLSYMVKESALRVITETRPAIIGGAHMAMKFLK